MSRVTPLNLAEVDPETAEMVGNAERLMGFVPNDALVMARQPKTLRAMWDLVASIYGPGDVDPGLKRLIGEAASKAAGCFYCSAHAAHGARQQGVDPAKIEAVWTFEDSDLFTDAERAAINIAMKAGRVPNEAEDSDFERLRQHFSETQIVEIVSVISLFGFLNRWNSTLGTQLEPAPAASLTGFAQTGD
jgi:uncharacterized peroxidase-related enzyme